MIGMGTMFLCKTSTTYSYPYIQLVLYFHYRFDVQSPVHCFSCRHAKRMTVNSDDVKLLVRKSPELVSITDISGLKT